MGESQQFFDEMDYLLDNISPEQPLNVRCLGYVCVHVFSTVCMCVCVCVYVCVCSHVYQYHRRRNWGGGGGGGGGGEGAQGHAPPPPPSFQSVPYTVEPP